MLPVVALPDTEVAAIIYLREQLAARAEGYTDNVTVGRFVKPTSLPFVAVRRSGGTYASPAHDRPRLDVMVWHTSDDNRVDLAQMCRALLMAADGDDADGYRLTFGEEFAGPIRMPDPVDPDRQIILFTHELLVRS